jgi:hypothetical protein
MGYLGERLMATLLQNFLGSQFRSELRLAEHNGLV